MLMLVVGVGWWYVFVQQRYVLYVCVMLGIISNTESFVLTPIKGRTQSLSSVRPVPPRLAIILLCVFLSHPDRDNVIGDLDERFPKWIKRHGAQMARLIYLKDAFTAVYPAVLKLLARLGVVTGVSEIVRRLHF